MDKIRWNQIRRFAWIHSLWARIGILLVFVRALPTIKDLVEGTLFVQKHWVTFFDFIGSPLGTTMTVIVGIVMIIIAIIRTGQPKSMPPPDILSAKYLSANFDLNGLEDHVSFTFEIDNTSEYEYVLSGKLSGHPYFKGGLFQCSLLTPWYAQLRSQGIEPNQSAILEITKILDLGLAYECAFKDPDYPNREGKPTITMDFSQIVVGICQPQESKKKYDARISILGSFEVDISESLVHWPKYRALYKRQRV